MISEESPSKQALAIAYAVKRKNMKRSGSGIMSADEGNGPRIRRKPNEIAQAIIEKLAMGGEVDGHADGDELDDDMGEDMFSDEADGEQHLAMGGEVDNNPKLEAADESDPKKKTLQGLLSRIRSRHMGL